MQPLEGRQVLLAGNMAGRALVRFLTSLGAELMTGQLDARSVARADFLVENLGLELLADQGIQCTQLEQWNPRLIHVSVSPFGSGNARSRWRAGELICSAMGGSLRQTGDPDRQPVKEALDACTFHADMVAAAGAMAAFYALARGGAGQHVDVSIQEVAFSRNVSGVLAWQFDRRKFSRQGGCLTYGQAAVRCIWPLADGWCFHSLMTGRFGAPANRALAQWIDEAGLDNPLRDVDWLSYDRSALPADTRARWETAIARFFRTRSKAEIRGEGRRRGINACVVESPADVIADPHLHAREFWQEDNGRRLPSRFVRLARPPGMTQPHLPAEPPAAAPAPATGEPEVRSGPLAGLRVLDFSWALVGSITTKILGDLGADVIKVESRKRPCLSRIDVQVSASKHGELDDKPWFAHLNTSKRSLALDLKSPRSRDVLDPLLDWADVVVENFSPGTMQKLGLDYAALAARRPELVMASGSVYGQTGPLASEWGVDGTGGALSGRTFLTGWADRDPVIPGAVPYGDVIVPYVMAASTLAALATALPGSPGCHIDASMYEICVQQMAPAIDAAQRGNRPGRSGNASPGVLAQDVYPAQGQDRWVAITLFDAADRERLENLTGPGPVSDWTAAREAQASVNELQRAGIAAGVVQDIEDLVERDAILAERGALVTLEHARLGKFGHVRTPVSFSLTRPTPYRAPALGEHGVDIATGLAGLSGAQVAELITAGVLE